jgi:hypothetical protein
MITIKCIKGFVYDKSAPAILRGEIFTQSEEFDDDFEGTPISRSPGMLISFTEDQLAENFEIEPKYTYKKRSSVSWTS